MTDEERQLSLLKGPRQRGEKAPGPSEFQMQCAVADLLRNGCSAGWMWTHFPAGELRTETTGNRLKRMGLQRGWPDLLLIDLVGRHYWLELKRGKAQLTIEQTGFGLSMRLRGVPWAVARSVDEALSILREWGAVRTGSSGRAD